MAMLEAFKRVCLGVQLHILALNLTLKCGSQVISDYVTPSGTSLPRHLPSVISKQVDLLSNTRVLAASMKTAIRELKKEIAVISVDTSDENVNGPCLSETLEGAMLTTPSEFFRPKSSF